MNKRLRKVVTMMFVLISLLTLSGQVALASEFANDGVSEKIACQIDKTNDYIYDTIAQTVRKAEKEELKNKMDEEEFEEYLDKLINELNEKIEKRVDKLIENAAKEGIEIVKTYVEVEICGRIILVDPCYAH